MREKVEVKETSPLADRPFVRKSSFWLRTKSVLSLLVVVWVKSPDESRVYGFGMKELKFCARRSSEASG